MTRNMVEGLDPGAYRTLAAGLMIVAAGCTPSETRDRVSATADTTPSGFVAVTNTSPGNRPVLLAEEDLRLGDGRSGNTVEFGRIGALLVTREGDIIVADLMDGTLYVFDREGRLTHTMGSLGEGPGEFGVVTGITCAPNGDLWVQDGRLGRYTVFSKGGTLVETIPFAISVAAIRPWPGFAADGRLLEWESVRDQPRDRHAFRPVWLSPEGVAERLPEVGFDVEVIDGTRVAKPYSGRPLLHVDQAGRLWLATSGEYRIVGRDLAGDTLIAIAMDYEPLPVSRAEKEAISRSWLRSRTVPLDQILDHKPPLVGITTDADGQVIAFPETVGAEAGRVMDVFGRDGVHRARVEFPVAFRTLAVPPVVRGNSVYGVAEGPDGADNVVRVTYAPGG